MLADSLSGFQTRVLKGGSAHVLHQIRVPSQRRALALLTCGVQGVIGHFQLNPLGNAFRLVARLVGSIRLISPL